MADNKYQNGKVYKIIDNGYNMCYYGSTTNELSRRMAQHRAHYARFIIGECANLTVYKIFETYGVDNCKIELVENVPCASRNELQAREGYYIKSNDCVNRVVVGRTDAQYREDNKDKIAKYYENNKARINERKKAHYEANKEVINGKVKQYKQLTDYNKKYRIKNAEKIRAHREQNREKNKKQRAEYYEKNKEQLRKAANERNGAEWTCECGAITTVGHKSRHLKTTKHTEGMAAKIQTIEI